MLVHQRVNGMIFDCGHVFLYSLGQFSMLQSLADLVTGNPKIFQQKIIENPGWILQNPLTHMNVFSARIDFLLEPSNAFLHHIFEQNMPKKTVTWDMPHPWLL